MTVKMVKLGCFGVSEWTSGDVDAPPWAVVGLPRSLWPISFGGGHSLRKTRLDRRRDRAAGLWALAARLFMTPCRLSYNAS